MSKSKRRAILQGLTVTSATGVVWKKPIVSAISLPVHASTTGPSSEELSEDTAEFLKEEFSSENILSPCGQIYGTLNLHWELISSTFNSENVGCTGIEITSGSVVNGVAELTGISVSNNACLGTCRYRFTLSADGSSLSGADLDCGGRFDTLQLDPSGPCFTGNWRDGAETYLIHISSAQFELASDPEPPEVVIDECLLNFKISHRSTGSQKLTMKILDFDGNEVLYFRYRTEGKPKSSGIRHLEPLKVDSANPYKIVFMVKPIGGEKYDSYNFEFTVKMNGKDVLRVDDRNPSQIYHRERFYAVHTKFYAKHRKRKKCRLDYGPQQYFPLS